jgi:hypothetical protein
VAYAAVEAFAEVFVMLFVQLTARVLAHLVEHAGKVIKAADFYERADGTLLHV